MPRKWLRLVAWVSLAAFLAANTHAGAPLGMRLVAALSPARQVAQPTRPLVLAAQGTASADKPTSCCKRCAKKACRVTLPPSPVVAEPERCPCGPSCPDVPKGRPCPSPGGCAFCSVAKVPCLAPAAPFLFASACLGDSLAEVAPLYTSPFTSLLARPPRA